VVCDHGAGDDSLPRSWWGNQDPGVVGNDLVKGPLLVRLQHRLEREWARHSDDSLVGHIQATPGLRDQSLQPFRQAARQHQVAIGALVVAADEPWGVPGGGTSPLPLVEDRVRHRRCVLEGGHQVRRHIPGRDGNGVVQVRVHRVGRRNADGRRRGGPDLVHRRADPDVAELAGQPRQVPGGHPDHAGQVRPLILVRFQGRHIQEHGGAAAPATALQRSGDQIAHTACGQHILGREQPVVTGQLHPSPQRDRLPQQSGADLPSHRRRDGGGGEEQPHVGAQPGTGHLQHRGRPDTAGRLQIRQRVQHRRRSVEICCQPAGLVPIEQRVQADVGLTGQMGGNHLVGQWQVLP